MFDSGRKLAQLHQSYSRTILIKSLQKFNLKQTIIIIMTRRGVQDIIWFMVFYVLSY